MNIINKCKETHSLYQSHVQLNLQYPSSAISPFLFYVPTYNIRFILKSYLIFIAEVFDELPALVTILIIKLLDGILGGSLVFFRELCWEIPWKKIPEGPGSQEHDEHLNHGGDSLLLQTHVGCNGTHDIQAVKYQNKRIINISITIEIDACLSVIMVLMISKLFNIKIKVS